MDPADVEEPTSPSARPSPASSRGKAASSSSARPSACTPGRGTRSASSARTTPGRRARRQGQLLVHRAARCAGHRRQRRRRMRSTPSRATVELWFSQPMDVDATNAAFALTDTETGALVGGNLNWNDAAHPAGVHARHRPSPAAAPSRSPSTAERGTRTATRSTRRSRSRPRSRRSRSTWHAARRRRAPPRSSRRPRRRRPWPATR